LPIDKRGRVKRGTMGMVNQITPDKFIEPFDGEDAKKRAHRKIRKRGDRKEYVEENDFAFAQRIWKV